jgi:hypothetical protein
MPAEYAKTCDVVNVRCPSILNGKLHTRTDFRCVHTSYVIRNSTILLLACVPLFGQQYTMSTTAGDGVAGAFLTNPMSVAVDSEGNVVFGDWSGFIRKIRNRDGALTIVAGTGILGCSGDGGQATSAMLGKSTIALDTAGDICRPHELSDRYEPEPTGRG